jgi:hypothetical protein
MTRKMWCVPAALALMALCHACLGAEEKPIHEKVIVPAPPATHVVEEVSITAAQVGRAIRGTMDMRVRSLAREETWAPLFTGEVGVTDVKASGGGWFGRKPLVMRRAGAVGLLLPGKGDFRAEIDFAVPVKQEQLVQTATLPALSALTGVAEVTLDGANLDVSVEPEVPFRSQSTGEQTLVVIYGAVAQQLLVRWKPGAEVREVETIAFAEQTMLLDVSPGLARAESTLAYSVLQGRMETVSVGLPVDYSLLKVEGDNLRTWDVSDDAAGGRCLSVGLLDPEADSFSLTMILERTLESVPVELQVPQVTALGVLRQKGVVAVAVDRGLQAEILSRENVGQVNLSEMPAALGRSAERVSLALRYLALPFSVNLRVSTIEPKVYGEVSCLTVASLQRFRQYWDVQYEIRNAGLFQLRLQLAPGMKLISLQGEQINNQSLDPVTSILTVDLRSKAEGSYALGLQTQSEVEDPSLATLPTLGLVGVERQWGTIALSADSGVAVEPVELTGISQIDVAELGPMAFVQAVTEVQRAAAPALAFRYLSFPYRLRLAATHILPELRAEPLHLIRMTRKNLRYESVLNYRIKKAGVFQVRLHLPQELRASLVVTGPKVEDYSYDAESEMLTVQLTEKVADELSIALEAETLLGKELPKPGQSDTFEVPAVYTLGCEQERGYVALETTESVRLKRAGTGGPLHDIDVQEIDPTLLRRASDAKLAFRVVEAPWQLDLEVSSISPKIQAQAFNYVRFGEDYLIGTSTIEFAIQYAGVKEFFIRMPEGIEEPNIRGDNIKIQEKVDERVAPGEGVPAEPPGNGELWRVELQSEVQGDYSLVIEYTAELDPAGERREFAGPRVIGVMPEVEREIGYLAVTGDPSLELTALADALQNLTPIDEEEIPARFRELPPSVAAQIGRETVPILFALRYLAHPYRLALSSVRHDEADVVTAVIENCKLSTAVSKEGNRITTMVAMVRSRYQPFLEVRLPESTRLWHTVVNGRRVRPLTDRDAQGEITKVPIAQVHGVEGPVRVEMQWEELGASGLGKVARVGLDVPSFMGVRILRLGWVLQLPQGYDVISASGELDRIGREGEFEPTVRDLKFTGAAADRRQSMQQARRAQSQQMAANEYVLTARNPITEGSAMAPAFSGAQLQLPERFYFQGLILNPDEPAGAGALCMSSPAVKIGLALVVIATLAACGGLWKVLAGSPAVAFAVFAAALLVVAGVKVIAEENFDLFLWAILLTIAAAAFILGVPTVQAFLEARQAAAKQSAPAS